MTSPYISPSTYASPRFSLPTLGLPTLPIFTKGELGGPIQTTADTAYLPTTPPNPNMVNGVVDSNYWMPDWLKGAIGTKDAPGWGGMAIGGVGTLASAFMGMKQYGLAKETLAENKRQFELNYGAQKQTTNTALEDRQRARYASNPGAYVSPSAYMDQHGIK